MRFGAKEILWKVVKVTCPFTRASFMPRNSLADLNDGIWRASIHRMAAAKETEFRKWKWSRWGQFTQLCTKYLSPTSAPYLFLTEKSGER